MKRTTIWGTNPRTAPTPEMMPSTTRPFSQSATPMLSMKLSAAGMIISPKSVSLTQSLASVPIVVTLT